MKIKSSFLYFLFFVVFSHAQDITQVEVDSMSTEADWYIENPPSAPKEVEGFEDEFVKEFVATDNPIVQKHFEESFQEKYQGIDYQYTILKPKISLWDKFQNFLDRTLSKIFKNVDMSISGSTADLLIKIAAGLIIAGALYFLLRLLLNKEGNLFFSKNKRKHTNLDRNLEENIHEIDFEEVIAGFESKMEYRNAIRYHFLFVLKKLADKNRIQWNPEKTNKDYYTELEEAKLKASFKKLAYIFDYIWYGEHSIDEQAYTDFKKTFLSIQL